MLDLSLIMYQAIEIKKEYQKFTINENMQIMLFLDTDN